MEITPQKPSFLLISCHLNYPLSHWVSLAISLLVSLLLIFLVRVGEDEGRPIGEGHERLGSQLSAQHVTTAECRLWPGTGRTWTRCSQKSQCFAVQCSAHSFSLILLRSQDQILEHQVPWGINNLLFLIILQELYSSCLAAQMPLFQSFLLILVSGKMRMGVEGREDALASITTEDLPSPYPPGNGSVLGLLPCVFEWDIMSLSAELNSWL